MHGAIRSPVIFLIAALCLLVPSAQAQEKPLLSAKIRSVIQEDGIEAAQKAFDEAFPAHKADYTVDPEGFGNLASEYMNAGDFATAQVIAGMIALISQDMIGAATGGAMASPGSVPNLAQLTASAEAREQEREEQRAAEQAEWEAAEEARIRDTLGEPRDDLERFVGQYGDPAAQDETPPRNFFAALRCDGYLVVGAVWGDAANWHLKTLSDLDFEAQAFGGEIVSFSFEMGADGHASVMNTSADHLGGRLEYVGPLPEGWEACIPRPVR